jgi:PAS domain S-box-containing protein
MQRTNDQIEDKLRAILDDSRDLVHYALNLESSEFDYISPSSLTILGFTPEQIRAMGIAGFQQRIHPADRNRMIEELEASEHPQHLAPQIEYRFQHKNGSSRYMHEVRSIVNDDNRQPVTIVGTIADVSAEKRLNERLAMLCNKFNLDEK